MNDSALLTVRGLEKTYTGTAESLTILKNLDMTVDAGTKNIITGESGCGKSTLLNIIGGLDTLSAGSVRAGSYPVSSLDENGLTEYRARFLGLIFQFHYLLKDFTALENVFLPAYMNGMPKKKALERAEQLLCDVSLEKRMHHLPSQLSGGERQRAAVARALINNPELILADEPTGNLDPANAAVVSDVLFSMVEKYRKTLVLVTHDHGLAGRADICYRLTGGKLERV
ncbi:MAG: ABC transporter ATP-binding protein [Bacteroides sp.]|nr:ABC transporter ATP-binding protein [Prevotella sp.]MCM1407395.1 ABC transporter ATP-binding protein [Treponema brennaborense]MCM1469885.1 ABC transporter ATP-binding protein [Bacteroides sp.]